MADLKKELENRNDTLSLVLGYGDSSDGTDIQLTAEYVPGFDVELVDVAHGGPHFGSIVHPQRFKQLAYVGNKLWKEIPKDADVVALIESDLIWRAQTFIDLLELFVALEGIHEQTPILLSPMVMHLDERFYDTWAFRYNGVNFRNEKPYHKILLERWSYLEMSSVGSFILMDSEIAKQLCFPEEDVVVGFCKQARLLGARIFLDKLTKVYHP